MRVTLTCLKHKFNIWHNTWNECSEVWMWEQELIQLLDILQDSAEAGTEKIKKKGTKTKRKRDLQDFPPLSRPG